VVWIMQARMLMVLKRNIEHDATAKLASSRDGRTSARSAANRS
jgi:hypothetical protein